MAQCEDTRFDPVEKNYSGLEVGYSYADEITFTDQDGAIDITDDDFTMEVFDAAGGDVITLTVGAGLTIGVLNTLAIVFASPITDAAGKYTYKLIWNRVGTGENFPCMEGKITVTA